MKVKTNTPDRLTIEDRPWFVTGFTWFMGLACLSAVLFDRSMGLTERALVLVLGVGACFVAWRLMPFVSLDLDRSKGTLVVTHARVTGAEQITYALEDIVEARVQSDTTDGADLERLALKTKTDILPVEHGFSSQSRKAAVKQINAWLTPDE